MILMPRHKKSSLVATVIAQAPPGSALKRTIAPKTQNALARLEADLGGRDLLIQILSQASTSHETTTLIESLADPMHDEWGLAQVCLFAGLTTGDFLKVYEKAIMAKSHALVKKTLAEGMPAVADHLIKHSVPYKMTCGICHGTKEITELTSEGKFVTTVCKRCDADGKVMVEPDLEHQKLAFDLAEMLPKKGGGLLIQQNNMNSGSSGGGFAGGALERLQQSVAREMQEPIDLDPVDLEAEIVEQGE